MFYINNHYQILKKGVIKIQRITTQRKIILEELKKLKTHPTAVELYEIVRKRLPKISLGTVYRNLEIMSEEGLVKKLEIPGREKRWDGDTSTHYHFRCTICGRVYDIFMHENDIHRIENIIKKYTMENSEIKDINLEVVGVCNICQGKIN